MSMSSPPPPSSIPTYDYNLHIPQQPQQQQHQNSHSSSSSLSNLSPSIIITLLILSATIIVTTCLFLICRHFHRLSSFFRRRSSQRTVFLFSQHHHTQHPNTNPTNSLPNPNNSSALVDSLPLFSYSSVTRRPSSSSDGDDCAVCLSKFKAHDQLRLLPLCCHAFHAQCVDTWLMSNHTCPLCRSNVYASEADVASILNTENADRGTNNNSFRLEIGSISQRPSAGAGTGTGSDSFGARRSYSIGSYDYIVDGESEVAVVSNSDKEETNVAVAAAQYLYESSLAGDVGGGRSWLGEYMDRLSATVPSRTASFRSSRRFITGSSRRSEEAGVGEWDLDSSRMGEEISELFRWASGV